MTYPLSTDVTAGQPTAADHYNKLRADALTLGNAPADSLALGKYLSRHVENFSLQYLSASRVKVPWSIIAPPTIMINGYLLQAANTVTLTNGIISGDAATWYIFAVRSAGSTSFTLTASPSAVEATDTRLVGEVNWDGTTITSTTCYFTPLTNLPGADYDSGWFAVTSGTTYTKAHGIGQMPRIVTLWWCASTSAGANTYPVMSAYSSAPTGGVYSLLYMNATNVVITTGSGTSGACTLYSTTGNSSSGYYRILAWK
jgi:hypothetical protein